MKSLVLAVVLIFVCSYAQAQCVAEIKDVRLDEIYGSIIVETEYILNGKVVQKEGRNRFENTSGADTFIIEQAEKGTKLHCKNLIKRIEANAQFISEERIKRLDKLKVGRTSESIIAEIKDDLIGYKITETEFVDSFIGKDIKVTYDQKNTVSDSVLTP